MEKLTTDEVYDVFKSRLDTNQLVAHNIESFNSFIEHGLKDIIVGVFKGVRGIIKFDTERPHTYKGHPCKYMEYHVEFKNVQFSSPEYTNIKSGGMIEPMTPYIARQLNETYASNITIDIVINKTFYIGEGDNNVDLKQYQSFVEVETIPNFSIGSYPIMVKSSCCLLNNASPEQLAKVYREDPNDVGGYFILKGIEWSIDSTQSIAFNMPHVFNNNYQNEATRLEFISKPGDSFENSKQIIMFLYNNNPLISLRLVSNHDFIDTQQFDIPVQILFRLFGISCDREMFNLVCRGDKDLESRLRDALLYQNDKHLFSEMFREYDPYKLALKLGHKTLKMVNDDGESIPLTDDQIVELIMRSVNNALFPHIVDSNVEMLKRKKIFYLALMTRRILDVNRGAVRETQRNSFSVKRIHTAGQSIARAFKNNFRNAIIAKIRFIIKRFYQDLEKLDNISTRDTLIANLKTEPLKEAIETSIKSGEKESVTMKTDRSLKTVVIKSQQIARKNSLMTIATCRNIATTGVMTGSKSESNRQSKSVQASMTHRTCVTASADTGSNVGQNQQLAILAKISLSQNTEPVKQRVLQLIDRSAEDVIIEGPHIRATNVFINGDFVGEIVPDKETNSKISTYNFLKKLRDLRAKGIINKFVSISQDILTDEIRIFTDPGRLMAPYLKVYQHYHSSGKFTQYVKLNKSHVEKLRNAKSKYERQSIMHDLENNGIIEWISAEECENCVVCPSIDHLNLNMHNEAKEYTHCAWEQSVLGITALTSPFLNHTSSTRATYQTNQAKQTNGLYCLNPHHRFDKKRAHQNSVIEMPLVKTVVNDLLYPNGQNLIVAMMLYGGYNQEDSTILNKLSVESGMLSCYMYNYESIEIASLTDDRIGPITGSGIAVQRASANYSYLDERGIIKVGSVVGYGTVLVSKYTIISTGNNQTSAIDASLIYRGDEMIEIDGVDVRYKIESVISFVRVRYKSYRPLIKGDKLSTRSGNKNIVSQIMDPADMPRIKSTGVIPDMIVNPHSVPTRMVIGQLIECVAARLGLEKGKFIDGTAFIGVDVKKINQELEEMGLSGIGLEEMVCGKTGKTIKTLIFCGPLYIQRLQKFPGDEAYIATSAGAIDDVTRQPREGRSQNGGLKIGEMEKDCIAAHGSSLCMQEKFLSNIDKAILYVCKTCGSPFCIVNEKQNIYRCDVCDLDERENIVATESTVVNKIIYEYLMMLNIMPRLYVEQD